MSVVDQLGSLVCLNEIKASCPSLFAEILEREYGDIEFRAKDVEGQHVIDIGAHIGMFSLLCHASKAKSILCIEANPVNFRKLIVNLSKIDSVIGLLNCAVFDGSKNSVFMSNNNTQSAISVKGQSVKCISLDQVLSLYNEDVVMKMDIEGAEYFVLPSVSRTNLRKCKTIFLETHRRMESDTVENGRSSSFIKEYILSLGFKIEKEQQIFAWDIDSNGRPSNLTPIPNTQSFKFSRVD